MNADEACNVLCLCCGVYMRCAISAVVQVAQLAQPWLSRQPTRSTTFVRHLGGCLATFQPGLWLYWPFLGMLEWYIIIGTCLCSTDLQGRVLLFLAAVMHACVNGVSLTMSRLRWHGRCGWWRLPSADSQSVSLVKEGVGGAGMTNSCCDCWKQPLHAPFPKDPRLGHRAISSRTVLVLVSSCTRVPPLQAGPGECYDVVSWSCNQNTFLTQLAVNDHAPADTRSGLEEELLPCLPGLAGWLTVGCVHCTKRWLLVIGSIYCLLWL